MKFEYSFIWTAFVFLISLSGCDGQVSERGNPPLSGNMGEMSNAFGGSWQVIEIDGRRVSTEPPIGLAVSGSQLLATSGCIRWIWAVERETASLRVGVMRRIPVCERGRTLDEARFLEVMKSRPRLVRIDEFMNIKGLGASAVAKLTTEMGN